MHNDRDLVLKSIQKAVSSKEIDKEIDTLDSSFEIEHYYAFENKISELQTACKNLDIFLFVHDDENTIQESIKLYLQTLDPKESYGLTSCLAICSRTATLLFDSSKNRIESIQPDHHIVVAESKQLYPNLIDLFHKIDLEKYSMFTFTTGASRTADIEKTLVKGAHGPKTLAIFLQK